MYITLERYNTINAFLSTIEARERTGKADTNVKESVRSRFHGVSNYEEALDLYKNGLPDVCNRLKAAKARIKNAKTSGVGQVNKRVKRNYYVGYAPDIGRAVIGMPKDMRQIKRVNAPVKTISLIYNNSTNCDTSAADIMRSGEAVFTLAYALEAAGYKVNIDLLVYAATGQKEAALCLVNLKEYKQSFDMLKLSFPLCHPAAFRVFGFRWLETCPTLQNFWFGNGHQIQKTDTIRDYLRQTGFNADNKYLITIKDCIQGSYDYKQIAELIGLSI